jgi:hypothetical protein
MGRKEGSKWSALSRRKRHRETQKRTGCGREGEQSRCASSGRRGSQDPGKRERSGLKRCGTSVLLRSDEKKEEDAQAAERPSMMVRNLGER